MVSLLVVGALLMAGLSVPVSAAMYGKNSAVISLTADNFDSMVYSSQHAWIMEFYAPWCGHCQRLTPEYEKAAENLKGLVRVGAVDCDDQKNKALCGKFQVQGFPTLKIFPGSLKAKRSGYYHKEPKEYQGARSARAIADAGLAEMPNLSVKVTSGSSTSRQKNIDEFISAVPDLPKVLLFTTKTTTTPLYKALSVDFSERAVFGEVLEKEKELVTRFSISKFPTLVLLPKGDDATQFETYDGPLQHAKLSEFIGRFAAPAKENAKDKPAAPPAQEEEKFDPEVAKIETQEDLKKECLDRPYGMCLLSFMALEPEFEESVQQHQENMKVLKAVKKEAFDSKMPFRVVWLDAFKQQKMLQAFGLSDQYPSLMILSHKKKVFRPFTAGFEQASIMQFLKETSSAQGRHFKYDTIPEVSA